MRKLSRNARWHGLSPAQLKTLELWLFADKLTYADALQRATAELGFQGSLSSLKRFYQRRRREKLIEAFTDSHDDATAINAAPGNVASLRAAAMKLVAQQFLEQVRETPGEAEQWSLLARVLLQSEANQVRRELKQEENKIRAQRLALAREKFQCNVVERGLKALPELQKLEQLRKQPQQPMIPMAEKLRLIRMKMFGSADETPAQTQAREQAWEGLARARKEKRDEALAYYQEEIKRLREEAREDAKPRKNCTFEEVM
jgi:hypothetical protein